MAAFDFSKDTLPFRFAILLIVCAANPSFADSDRGIERYRTAPDPIPQILDTPPPPSVSIDPTGNMLAIFEREAMPPIERLAKPELRLAGTRINPVTNGPSRSMFFLGIVFRDIDSGEEREARLHENALISSPAWSPDGSRIAFTLTTADGIELWFAETATGAARRVTGPELNATIGTPFEWMPGGESLLIRRVPDGRGPAPKAPLAPAGPVIQESTGQPDPVRTHQDLLASPHDEALFEYYFTSQPAIVPVDGGAETALGEPGVFSQISVSPDGRYVLLWKVKRPYTYQPPIFAFAVETNVLDRSGTLVYQVEDRTDIVLPPIGRDMVRTGPRFVHWRGDANATLVWAEAMDGGDARRAAETRERVYMLSAPFDGEPRVLIDLNQRYQGVDWGRDDRALVHSIWRTTSRTRTHLVNPADPESGSRILWDRSAEDRYGDPGSAVTRRNEAGRSVLRFDSTGEAIFLRGDGALPDGDYPFIDRLNLESGETRRLWRSTDPYYEHVAAIRDPDARELVTRRESLEDPPNYYLLHLDDQYVRALTDFPDPAPQLAGIQREIITYPREDGVFLSATLVTPPGYDPGRDGPLPMLVWADPREFRDAAAAAQVRDSANRFSRPAFASPLFLLTQGYAILSGPAMPIIGEGDIEQNDTYIEQLVASAEAAVEKIVEIGVAERGRIAVGGHSYGAFMAANLLAHSDLFQSGIARSGAFNRSLTPFGFQAEPRSYWEARDTYQRMSPFNYAERITAPVLLIHGREDNNPGTYSMQSERMFQALKGTGGVARP